MENNNSSSNTLWTVIVVIIIILVLGFIWWGIKDQKGQSAIPEYPVTQTFDQSVSDGVITAKYLSTDFGLATTLDQILLSPTVVSPCGGGFNYCLYLSTTTYNGSNFESAGVSITKRADLKTEKICTDTPPAGYDASVLPDARKPDTLYTSSVFKNVGDSGAGHVVDGTVYRLFYKQTSTCYEVAEKVAYTQYGNYPSGSIKEFTSANKDAVIARLENIVDNMSIKGATTGIFP